MKILLTTLHSKYIHASLALPCLAAYCGDACGEILIAEYSVHEPKEALLAQLVAHDADVVCFSVYLWNRVLTLELVQGLKQIRPNLRIVLGGPEVSFEDESFFRTCPVDAVVCGEGEIPLRHLLSAWIDGAEPQPLPGLKTPVAPTERGWSLLSDLDEIPSPFAGGLVNLQRGLVYYESSRGCPYSCSFCMSALDQRVRSYSPARIEKDLLLLMEAQVPLVKFVDRTFNYDAERTRRIFSFILEHNSCSQFHFEIGAHLLDRQTMELLEEVPPACFQFEIGVQSTLPQTLRNVHRSASLERLVGNVQRLRQRTRVHLHLDLIAGLPGENYLQFLTSIDQVYALRPQHLQLEPVKLLPGAPLRQQTGKWGIRFDPAPPYSILASEDMSFAELERLRGIGRLLDLLVNSQRFTYLLPVLEEIRGRPSLLLEDLDDYWRQQGLYYTSRSLKDLYLAVDDYLCNSFKGQQLARLRESLARDFARHERVSGGTAPDFFDVQLTDQEELAVKLRVKDELQGIKRTGKVQFFAAAFHFLAGCPGRTILIFLYHSRTSAGLTVKEIILPEMPQSE